MHRLPQRKKIILVESIRRHKRKCFPGIGSGIRLAEEVGVTPQTVSNWLNGSRLPTMSQMYRLAKAFNVSPLELCGIRRKDTRPSQVMHLTVLQNLLQLCEKSIVRGDNPHITRKLLLSFKGLIQNDLCE